MKWDDNSIAQDLGVKGGLPSSPAVVRYVAGCMKRERERLAKIIEAGGTPEEVAAAIRSEADDADVFQWRGP